MAQWKLDFHVDVDGNESNARLILKKVSKVEPRPSRAVYGYRGFHRVDMSFIIDAESESEAHEQQSRIHDSLSKVIDEVECFIEREQHIEAAFAIEFDTPKAVEEEES